MAKEKRIKYEMSGPKRWTYNDESVHLKNVIGDDHTHTAELDRFGNGATSPGLDGHIHPVREGIVLDAGYEEDEAGRVMTHMHKLYFTEPMGSSKGE